MLLLLLILPVVKLVTALAQLQRVWVKLLTLLVEWLFLVLAQIGMA
jgi:hypothetical protein